MIKNRIKTACDMTLLPIEKIARKASLSTQQLCDFMKGISVPSTTDLRNLAKVCDVYPEYFFRKEKIYLRDIDYYSLSELEERQKKALKNRVINLAENFMELQSYFNYLILDNFKLPQLPEEISEFVYIENIAELLHKKFNIGRGPVFSVRQTLHDIGILTVDINPHISMSDFKGVKCVSTQEVFRPFTSPVFAISTQLSPRERRFTLAYMLGWLVLKDRLPCHIVREKAYARFASAFLAPRRLVIETAGINRESLSSPELEIFMHTFGLPFERCLERLRDCHIVSKAGFSRMDTFFKRKSNKALVAALNDIHCNEEKSINDRFIWRAFSEGIISERKASTKLGLYLDEFYYKDKCYSELCELNRKMK